MDLPNVLIKFISKYFNLGRLNDRWRAITNLGKAKNVELPRSTIALNIDVLSRSFYNLNAIQPNLDWVMPFWVVKQFDPEDRSFLPSNYLSINLTHRNWTAFSSLHSDFEAIIDPRGLLTPLFDSWSVDFWIRKGDYVIIPSRLDKMSQHLVNKFPIVKSIFYKKGLQVTSESLMHGQDGRNFILSRYLIENSEPDAPDISFFVAIRPYNPEGMVPVFSIEYREAENAFLINGKDYLYLEEKPARVVCSNQDGGDAFFHVHKKEKEKTDRSEDPSGLCTAFAEYKVRLEENASFGTGVCVPVEENEVPAIKNILKRRFNSVRNENIAAWEERTAHSLRIRTPDSLINDAWESSKSNLLVLLDEKEIPPGPFTYHTMWFRDAAYSLTALLKLGFSQDVKRILGHYFKKQQKDGFFLSQQAEWDSNGQVLWTMAQYWDYTRDTDFIRGHFNALKKAAEWIFRRRKQSMGSKKSPEYGLLPPGFSAEHFGPANYYYWDNLWSFAGIRDFIRISEELGKDVSDLKKENGQYLADIENSIRLFQQTSGEGYIPSSPYRTDDSSIISSVVGLYPLQIFDPYREDVTRTLRLIRKKYMNKGAFFHKLVHSGYNVYLTAQLAECYLMRKSTFSIPILEWILKHATDTFTFPEAIHPETGGGCMGDGHHGWATSELIHLIRNMVFYEKAGRLVFFPVIPHHWLDLKNELIVENAASSFGRFGLSLKSTAECVEFTLQADFHCRPERIEVNLPVLIEKIERDGKEISINAKSFEIPALERQTVRIYI